MTDFSLFSDYRCILTLFGIFWCLILPSSVPFFCSILFCLCYFHSWSWPWLIWPNNHHACCYENIFAILSLYQGHFLYSMSTCLNWVYIIRLTSCLSMSFANWWWRARYKSSPEFWFFLLFHTPECSKGSANHWSRCPCSPHQKGLSNSVLANKNSKLSCAEIMEPEAKRGKLSRDSSGARSMKDCHSWGCHATTCNYQYMFSNQRVFSGC